jgi:hypothetical protein
MASNTTEPTISEVIRDAIIARLAEVMTCTVGRIKVYDPKSQTAEIVLVMRRPFNIGADEVQFEDLPVLPNVPILWPRTGSAFIHLPLMAGDHVLVVFTHDNIGAWRATGSVSEPDDLRRHGLGSAVAIPGIAPDLEPLTDAPLPGMDPTEAVLGGGVFRVGSKTGAVPVALAPIVAAFITAFNAHTHGTGVGPTTTPVAPFTQNPAATKLKAE